MKKGNCAGDSGNYAERLSALADVYGLDFFDTARAVEKNHYKRRNYTDERIRDSFGGKRTPEFEQEIFRIYDNIQKVEDYIRDNPDKGPIIVNLLEASPEAPEE